MGLRAESTQDQSRDRAACPRSRAAVRQLLSRTRTVVLDGGDRDHVFYPKGLDCPAHYPHIQAVCVHTAGLPRLHGVLLACF